MKIDLNSISDGGNPYEKFCDHIRDADTKRKYKSYLKQFLEELPDNVYKMISDHTPQSDQDRARLFTTLAKKDQELTLAIIEVLKERHGDIHKEFPFKIT